MFTGVIKAPILIPHCYIAFAVLINGTLASTEFK